MKLTPFTPKFTRRFRKSSTNEYKAKVEELLENVRRTLIRRVEESIGRCRKWIRRARDRFMERVERLRAIDAGLADTIKSKLRECFEYTSHGGSTGDPRWQDYQALTGTLGASMGSPHGLQG